MTLAVTATAVRLLTPRRLLVALGLALLVGIYIYLRADTTSMPTAALPELPMDGVDPAVAAAVGVVVERVRNDAGSGDAWGQLGMVLRANGFDEQSNPCFAEAERRDPRNPRWPYLLAHRDSETAENVTLDRLRRAATLADTADAGNPTPRLTLAEALLRAGHLDEAEAEFRKVHERDPEQVRAQYGLGVAARERGDLKASAARFERCINSPFARQKACGQLSAVYTLLGDAEQSARCTQLARDYPRDVDWADPYVAEYLRRSVGKEYRLREANRAANQGFRAKSIELIEALALETQDGDTQTVLGKSLAREGNLEAAEEVLAGAVRLRPDSMQAHYFLAVALFEQAEKARQAANDPAAGQARYERAAAAARRATELKPDHALSHMILGQSLRYLGDKPGAATALRRATACRPELTNPHLFLGEVLASEGRDGEALGELLIAVRVASLRETAPGEALGRLLARIASGMLPPVWP